MNARQFDMDGALCMWRPVEVPAARAEEAFASVGMGDLAPKARTEYEALREAVALLKAKDQKLERHKSHAKNGLEVLQVGREDEENSYDRRMGARVHENEWGRKLVRFDCEVSDYDRGRVDERFDQASANVSTRSLTMAIVEAIQKMDGEREIEGVWFVPNEHLDTLYQFADALERIGVGLVPFQVRLDERAARHIGDSLTERMTKEAERLQEEIAGLKTPEAIESRQLEIAELRGRVNRYKDLLGDSLAKAEEVLTMADTVAMIASMSAMQGVVC